MINLLKIKDFRIKKGLSQKDLAKQLGIAPNTYNQYEKNKRQPDLKTLQDIADYFEVTIDDLIDNDTNFSKKQRAIKIPVLGYVRAGIPVDAIQEILDYEEISEDMACQGDFFGLKVKGDSMEPRIQEGDIVIVRQQSDVESGDIAVVLVNGNDATVKKFIKHKTGVSLVAFNSKYEPMFFTCKEVMSKPVSIIGKVVELRAKF